MSINLRLLRMKSSSIYAIERDGVNLPEAFLEQLSSTHPKDAQWLAKFIDLVCSDDIIHQDQFRGELPNDGVFAMYQHRATKGKVPYSSARLLCAFVGRPCKIVIAGAGFIKTRDEPVQDNHVAWMEAKLVADVGKWIQRQIDCGEVTINGAHLAGTHSDSLTMK